MAKVKAGAKKKFFEVKMPFTAAKVHVYAHSVEEAENTTVKIDMTRSLRGKSLEFKARVKKDGDSLTGAPVSLELLGSYIRRMFRKGADYVEDSFEADSKDAKLRVKPFMLTRNKVSRAIRNELRSTTKKHLEAHFKTRTVEELFTEVLTNKMQRELSLKLKKIYPLALCEIRVLEIVPEKAVPTIKQ